MEFPALTTNQMREVDRLMVDIYGIALEQMMENTGCNLAKLARRMLDGRTDGRPITILCGPGNNGGGGMVAARHLHNGGAKVNVVLAADKDRLNDVPKRQWDILRAIRLDRVCFPLESSVLILDALLGYGATGNPRPPINEWIERANASDVPILSLDSPSGLDTTSGRPGQPCVRAEATMTLALPKTGLLAQQGKSFVGELYLADIGVPPELYTEPSLGLSSGPLFVEGSLIKLG